MGCVFPSVAEQFIVGFLEVGVRGNGPCGVTMYEEEIAAFRNSVVLIFECNVFFCQMCECQCSLRLFV